MQVVLAGVGKYFPEGLPGFLNYGGGILFVGNHNGPGAGAAVGVGDFHKVHIVARVIVMVGGKEEVGGIRSHGQGIAKAPEGIHHAIGKSKVGGRGALSSTNVAVAEV